MPDFKAPYFSKRRQSCDETAECRGRKNSHILPTGQWYAPSAVINYGWYCMVLHGVAFYFMVLHGITWIAWYCMVLHGIALLIHLLLKGQSTIICKLSATS